MSQYTMQELAEGVATAEIAWHQHGTDRDTLIAEGRLYPADMFPNGIPADVAAKFIGWRPVVIEPVAIVDIDGTAYTLPDRLSKVIANPNTRRVINVVGDGWNADLHIVVREAIQAAMDAECNIVSVVNLGDGMHLGMSLTPRDGIVIKGFGDGVVPIIGMSSSLGGASVTQVDTGSIVRVCDNTIKLAETTAVAKLKTKRTRFAHHRITAATIREALGIAFEQTEFLAAEFDRLANVPISNNQLTAILDGWKPLGDTKGRGQTIAVNTRATFVDMLTNDPRNPFGQTVAGVWQTHNTWAHWGQTMRGETDRLARQAVRTATGQVDKDDAAFMAIVAGIMGKQMTTV